MDADYELEVPFTLCESRGGPYQDGSFVAGWQAGALYTALKAGIPPLPGTPYYTALIPQLDLIAMAAGFKMVIETESEEWTNVTFEVA